jgi:hypothetical protein
VSEHLTWALGRARALTLLLVADVRPDQMHLQSAPGERHPAWLLGHLLLADTYLLSARRAAVVRRFPVSIATVWAEVRAGERE